MGSRFRIEDKGETQVEERQRAGETEGRRYRGVGELMHGEQRWRKEKTLD